VSAAYVLNFTYKRFNPFLEAGPAAFLFEPLDDASTTTINAKKTTSIGGVYGAGVAYEISPSFDIRAEYRGLVMKTPNFDLTAPQRDFTVGRYYNVSAPTIGIAYHF
jgi:outer membrane immunogenic protein